MDAYLTPALLGCLVAVVAWYGRKIDRTVAALCRCHLSRHPEDVDKFTIGG